MLVMRTLWEIANNERVSLARASDTMCSQKTPFRRLVYLNQPMTIVCKGGDIFESIILENHREHGPHRELSIFSAFFVFSGFFVFSVFFSGGQCSR